MIKEIYLIGGGPRTGKSTIAKAFAKNIDANYISVDDIRGFVKALRPENISSDLYYDLEMEIEDFYAKYPNPEDVIELEKKQNKAVEHAIELLIENFYNWQKVVIEGIGITPSLIKKWEIKYNAKGIIIAVKNPETIKQRIYSNGLWDNENPYPDIYKEKEVVWANMYNEWMISGAKINEVPVLYENEVNLENLLKVVS